MASNTKQLVKHYTNAIRHLRFGFSIMLMPAFLLSIAMIGSFSITTFYLFVILHIFVYPASNAYNTYFDRDKGAIGGYENPTPVGGELKFIVQTFDLIAILLTTLFARGVLIGILTYQIASRLYSYNKVRIKALPWLSLIMVGLFQGVLIFALVTKSVKAAYNGNYGHIGMIFLYLIASYPITQSYQIEEDLSRGENTSASILGLRGSLIFTGLAFGLYLIIAIIIGLPFLKIFLILLLPIIIVFAKLTIQYLRTVNIGYKSVRLLVILNWLSVFIYFAILIYLGQIE